MKELEQAIEVLTKLRVDAFKHNQDGLEKSLYELEQMIFKAQDSLQSKGKTKKSPKEFLKNRNIHTTAWIADQSLPEKCFLISDLLEEYAQSHANQDGVKEEENTPVRIYRDVAVCQKVEAILKPEYMNTVYTWVQIKEAILATP